VVEEFDTHVQSDLLVHTQSISLAWDLICVVVVVVELWPSSLDLPSNQFHFYPSS
jgi:hypothetical protein